MPDGEIAAVRGAGFDDAAMVEIAAAVALNTFANLVNNLAQTSAQAESQRGIGE